MKSTSPTWLIMLSAGSDDAGNSKAESWGATHPKHEGPSRRPTIISAMTAGCRSLAKSGVARRHNARMTAIWSSSSEGFGTSSAAECTAAGLKRSPHVQVRTGPAKTGHYLGDDAAYVVSAFRRTESWTKIGARDF